MTNYRFEEGGGQTTNPDGKLCWPDYLRVVVARDSLVSVARQLIMALDDDRTASVPLFGQMSVEAGGDITPEKLSLMAEFQKFCDARDINPEKLLERFMADCVGGDSSSGSDERMYAALYVERLGPTVYNDHQALWDRLDGKS